MQPTAEMLKDRGYDFFNIVGAVRAGGERRRRRSRNLKRLRRTFSNQGRRYIRLHAGRYQEVLTGPVRPVLYALFGALGLVLLIACANVSNLLIARCLGRQQEFAVRSALGASRVRLVRQMLSEGLALSVLGCGVGVGLAEVAMVAVRKLPDGHDSTLAIRLGSTGRCLVLAAVAIATTVLSSLLPALLVARANPQAALQAASRGTGLAE